MALVELTPEFMLLAKPLMLMFPRNDCSLRRGEWLSTRICRPVSGLLVAGGFSLGFMPRFRPKWKSIGIGSGIPRSFILWKLVGVGIGVRDCRVMSFFV